MRKSFYMKKMIKSEVFKYKTNGYTWKLVSVLNCSIIYEKECKAVKGFKTPKILNIQTKDQLEDRQKKSQEKGMLYAKATTRTY